MNCTLRLLPLPCLWLFSLAAVAQTPPPAALVWSGEQRVERMTHEDAWTRIDELRVGGRTQRITVQPKNGMPVYEMRVEHGRPVRGGWRISGF